MEARIPLSHEDYTVGWICALPLEMAAAKLMLAEFTTPAKRSYYHNVVIASLPSGAYGNTSATSVGMQLLSSFHSIRFGFMVGIGGGVPSSHADIRLGDIVVSQPTDTSGGVIQYDLGKALSGGQFKRTGMLNRPPKVLLTALATLQAHHLTEDSRITGFVSNLQAKIAPHKAAKFTRPTQEDCLFQAEYDHVASDTCIDCDRSKLFPRPPRENQKPVIHYGLIGSASQVVKDGRRRDQLARDLVHRFDVLFDLTAVPVITNFVGRQSELDQLWQYLRPTDPQSRKVAIIHGLGGVGKTQLAIRFARDQKDDFTAIFWLSGKDRGTLLQSLSSIWPRLPGQSHTDRATNDEEVEQRARHVLKWLAERGNSRWLIIFDNINQYAPFNGPIGDAYDIGEFFPTADHGSILLTSRLQRLTELGKSFQLNRLDSKDAMQLLLQSTHLSTRDTVSELESNPDTHALASRLDGLPLAIVIAGAFMRETGTSATEYLQYYQESWSELQLQSNPERQYQQGNLLQTWMISYYEIQKRDPHAAKLLLLLAHFDNRDICSDVPVWLERTISSGLAFRTGVKNLIGSLCLGLRNKSEAIRYTQCTDQNVDSTELNKLALISVGYSVPSRSDRNYSELQERLIPHANHVRHRDWSSGNISIAVWGAFHGLGNLYSDQGKLKEAEEIYQRALVGYEKAFGPDHTSTLSTVHKLGILYSNQGKLKEAEELY
ncbi:uncharacterized protein N7477_009010 [Penicillium maclennaniae]|uniref:uncharacterized protein n=1 Tax=Penicillium maclennaniae TaxID=1343394 RepID=UPI002540B5B9|nr:uncharacterized protein N7477_009010 [Penicillium maclennaniae]KAJ5661394.1 hypothetical protein N7477_009010 [Penicillium maclennaniae]